MKTSRKPVTDAEIDQMLQASTPPPSANFAERLDARLRAAEPTPQSERRISPRIIAFSLPAFGLAAVFALVLTNLNLTNPGSLPQLLTSPEDVFALSEPLRGFDQDELDDLLLLASLF
jgi:hypothetical protein